MMQQQAQDYKGAMRTLEKHLRRAPDGTFILDVQDPTALGLDPVIYADLARSLERTNDMIRRGELDPAEVGNAMP